MYPDSLATWKDRALKQIEHPQYGSCYELEKPNDIGFSNIAQGAQVNATILPSGTKTPDRNLFIREKYLVEPDHKPK
jgi:hypothetical protein